MTKSLSFVPNSRINLIGGALDETLRKLPPVVPGTVIWVVTNDTIKPVQSWVNYTRHPERAITWFFEHHTEVTDYWLGLTPPLRNAGEVMIKVRDHFAKRTMLTWYDVDYPEIVEFLIGTPWKMAETITDIEIRKLLENAEEISCPRTY